jgi:thiosulfate/3-mercaptopyruvate sulfurtransferase
MAQLQRCVVPDVLVSTDWLQANLSSPDLAVVDCSWHLPESGRSGHAEFIAGHIPGARFLDLNDISDATSPYANMMPPPAQFATAVEALGIGSGTNVVVYDGSYVSARVWWMFRAFGHDSVRILDGGWRKWVAEKRAIAKGEPPPIARGRFGPASSPAAVAGWQEVLEASRTGTPAIVDARTAERFTGAMPSGYPGVPGGHIPGSVNIPWSRFYEKDFRFVAPEIARRLFEQAGVDLAKPVIATCGSGVTAAILVMMLERVGHTASRLYDGSWHECGQRLDLPKSSIAAS